MSEREQQISAVIARRDRQIRLVTIVARVVYVACGVFAVLTVVAEWRKR